MTPRHNVQFPPQEASELGQDEAYFYLMQGGEKQKIRLHDYDRIFEVPGLYEQVVYERLRCQSPERVSHALEYAVSQSRGRLTELRVLDLGAGNGMMGDELRRMGAARLVGIDIIQEARDATLRDRPGVYDDYQVVDFCSLDPEHRNSLQGWHLNALTTVAALGFGDIPTRAFMEAFNLIDSRGWVAFNIKETFLEHSDRTGFSTLIRELIFSDYLDLYSLQRYRHRYSVDGTPLYYFAVAGRKSGNVPAEFLESAGVNDQE
jgi:hypothetical protein